MNIGWTELLLILGVALLFFGPSRLPSLGKSLGEAIRGFKKGLDDQDPHDRQNNPHSQISHDGKAVAENSELSGQSEKTEKTANTVRDVK